MKTTRLLAALVAVMFMSVAFGSVAHAGYVFVSTLKKGSVTVTIYRGTPSGKAYVERGNSGVKTRYNMSPSAAIRLFKKKGYR